VLQESQAHGQLVREWQVALGFETETAPLKWHRVAAGLSIGHKRTVAVPTHWQSEYKLTHIKLTVLGVAEQESGPGEGEAETAITGMKVGGLVGWLVGWLVSRQAGRQAGRQVGRQAGRQVGWVGWVAWVGGWWVGGWAIGDWLVGCLSQSTATEVQVAV
jgi:hypothetical protein